ncbi:MAG: NADPH:quinone reductase [Alphaproteobacteria bacterium]|uniref:NADPH:quinone reductase n=1 Tax=Candidatus Nitrobium versatile TaxID=2884831 RepID=A0A953LZD1_9BACT|nr:NADPH:quinone reductase [Candidatus Nitrobium versatile]
MKAIRVHAFGAPGAMRLEDISDPVPQAGQVVVRVYAAGINPVDTYIRSGLYSPLPPLPYTPGLDAAGVVEAVGEGVRRVSVGDRVYMGGSLSGTYAEKALCPESQVHPLPPSLSFPQGAGINVPYGAAYHALFHRAHAVPGETVLVHGASGGVGIATVQWARTTGMRVIGTGGTEKGRQLVVAQGAHFVLDHHAPGHMERVLALTDGKGADVILEMLANVNLGRDLGVLAEGGRIVVVGSRGTVSIDPRDIMRRNASITGMLLLSASAREMLSIHAAIAAGLENGILRPFVGREMPLSEAARAHHEIMESSAYGKIVLIP